MVSPVLLQSDIPGFPLRRGKVRDVYELDSSRLLIVATDRISAFDVIMPTGIPDKGRILTQLSNFWFAYFQSKLPSFHHHLIETSINSFPYALRQREGELTNRSVIVRKTTVLPIECVVRGYLTGSGWKDYLSTGKVSGISLPPGLKQCEKLPEPIFTPSTKAEAGHDMPISFEQAAQLTNPQIMQRARDLAITLYNLAAGYAQQHGILLADTKFEFGTSPDIDHGNTPILIDEACTPDSSRFWPADQYQIGREQPSFDKQYLRNYLETLDWNKTPPGPELPAEVVAATRAKYVEAYEKLTLREF